MISKTRLKLIKSLALKKKRDESGLFVAEGAKTVAELLKRFACCSLYVTEECEPLFRHAPVQPEIVSREELTKASLLTTPHNALAVFRKPEADGQADDATLPARMLCLGLDDVQDPGNLGTIIRIADWFGLEHVFCSLRTADAFSPKTVQATMGALARVHVHYVPLDRLLSACHAGGIPVYGTFLDGDNMYTQPLSANGLILMGNEGNGISPEAALQVTHRLFIPSYPPDRNTSESLNVAVATAIVCAEFRRRHLS